MSNPLKDLFSSASGDPETFRQLQWPLFLRVGTVR